MTKKLGSYALLLALVFSLCTVPALAETSTTANLTVYGTASIRINPDRAILSIGFSVEDPDLTQAQQIATDRIQAITTAVQKAGVTDNNILTTRLDIGPVYNYDSENSRTIRGYCVEHMLEITVSELGRVASVMDAALKAGANITNGIVFQSSTDSEAYQQALHDAIAVAQAKAQTMASASAKSIRKLVSLCEITENHYSDGLYSNAKMDLSTGAGIGETIMSGAIQVSATVEMAFEIE